jgi:hypothetical protein
MPRRAVGKHPSRGCHPWAKRLDLAESDPIKLSFRHTSGSINAARANGRTYGAVGPTV